MSGSRPFVAPLASQRSFYFPPFDGAWSESITSAPAVSQIRDQFKPGPAQSHNFYASSGRSQMEHLRLHLAHHRSPQIPHYDYTPTIHYQPVMSQSYLRSSSHHSQAIPHSQSFTRDSPVSPYSSSGFQAGSIPTEASFGYAMEGDYDPAHTGHGDFYNGEHGDSSTVWAYQERPTHNDLYATSSYPSQDVLSAVDDHSALVNRYLKQENPPVISLNDLSSGYFAGDNADSALTPYPSLQGHADASTMPMTADFVYGYNQTAQPQAYGGASPSFTLTSDPQLHYPPASDAIPRFVSPAQISPGVSPAVPLLSVDHTETTSLDPRYTVGSPPATLVGSQGSLQGGYSGASPEMEQTVAVPSERRPTKRRRAVSFTSSSSSEEFQDAESEKESDEGMDDDDEEYVQGGAPRGRSRRRTISSASSSSRPDVPTRRLAPPVPVPNLTKKSRGRRVPTATAVLPEDGVEKSKRSYMCEVAGCGKCFARGEHLKRHVRSIHTNEKPHRCPYPGCGKDFSRHDNLGQHMRVHKNWPSKQRHLAGPG